MNLLGWHILGGPTLHGGASEPRSAGGGALVLVLCPHAWHPTSPGRGKAALG